jgi:hypothetical protein
MPSGLEESLLLFTLAHGLKDFRQQQIELRREFDFLCFESIIFLWLNVIEFCVSLWLLMVMLFSFLNFFFSLRPCE